MRLTVARSFFTTTQAIADLEATNAELKADLKDLYINSATEVSVAVAHGDRRSRPLR